MKISDKWYCEVPEEFIDCMAEIVKKTRLGLKYGSSDHRQFARGRYWGDEKYIGVGLDYGTIPGYTKISINEAIDLIKSYKKDLPETVEIKTSRVLEAAGQCSDFKHIAKTLWPEIF
jgi:hypothetical protein